MHKAQSVKHKAQSGKKEIIVRVQQSDPDPARTHARAHGHEAGCPACALRGPASPVAPGYTDQPVVPPAFPSLRNITTASYPTSHIPTPQLLLLLLLLVSTNSTMSSRLSQLASQLNPASWSGKGLAHAKAKYDDDVVIVASGRTPFCKARKGGLKDTP